MMDDQLDTLLHDAGARWRTDRPTAPDLDSALRQVAGPHRRIPWLAIAASVLVVALVAAIPVVRTVTRHSANPSADISATTRAALVRVAQQQVDGCGGGGYRATAVATTQGAVDEQFGAGGSQEAARVWAIQIVRTAGLFTCPHSCPANAPLSACVSHVPVLILTVVRTSYAEILFAAQTERLDLSKLGRVVQIHP